MEVDFNDKSDFGLKVKRFGDHYRSKLIYDNHRYYWYDDNRPNYGKRCNAKGREVTEEDILKL